MTREEYYRLRGYWEAGKVRRDYQIGLRSAPSKSSARLRAKATGQILKKSYIRAQTSINNPQLKGEYKTVRSQ